MNLNSILVGSEDPKRLREYYANLFGKPAYEADDFSSWQFGSGWMSVGSHDQVKGKNAHPGRVIWNFETPDVKAEFERLQAAGPVVHDGERVAWHREHGRRETNGPGADR